MNKWMVTCAALVPLWLPQGDAFADAQAGQAYVSPMASYIDGDDDSMLDEGVRGGQFGIGRAVNNLLNIEGYFSFASLDGSPGQDQSGFGADLQFHFNRQGLLTPYLFFGAGHLSLDVDGGDDPDGFMYSGGAGVIADIFGDRNVALRAEYRRRHHEPDNSEIRDNIFSLGLQIPFGDAPVSVTDSDGDGVADSVDRCPGTPAGTPVDEYGCERDSDGDGVADSMDQCPNTPRGTRVDARGCPQDSDGDGVADGVDECPGTPRGARVDEKGCELDSDGDGVVDRLDECPNTAKGVQVDIKGCEIKEEIRLPGVNFETNSDRLLSGAENTLDDAVATLKKNPSIKVEVQGHTDSDGTAKYNEGLSQRRAKTVRDYLVEHGIAADRLTTKGYGELAPIDDNSTAEGKAANRRVVLRITDR